MKQGKSILELATELERQARNRIDIVTPTSAIEMEPSGLIHLGDEARIATSHAHRQIGSYLNIPAQYYDRMLAEHPDLLAANVNRWMSGRKEKRMVRALDGNIRAFLSDKYQRIDNNHVAEVVLPILREVPEIEIKSCEVTENRMYIKAITHAVRGEVRSKRVGDFVEAGVMIRNSETGSGALAITPFFHFLVCTNGMVRNAEGMRAAHVGRRHEIDMGPVVLSDTTKRLEDLATLSKVKDTLRNALDQAAFDKALAKIADTVNQPIEGDPVEAIQVLGDSFGMLEQEKTSVLRHLIEGGDLSKYGLINAVTRTAEDLVSYDRATEFETFGGSLVDMTVKQWKAIATAE
jgi:hypothetical protein